MDSKWWEVMKPEFKGQKLTSVDGCKYADKAPSLVGKNSGIGALFLARHLGAERIIMLGYDCKIGVDGKKHWHGDHKHGLGNAGSLPQWTGQFMTASNTLQNIDVLNCTRDTALNVFPKAVLEDVLC